jgi:hypothetical protein
MYAMKEYTTEQLTERWEAHNEITNLVGRLSFWEILRDTDAILSQWCGESATPCLGLQNGYYKGRAAIEGYYRAIKEIDLVKAETAVKLHPAELAGRAAADARGAGSLRALNFTTPVLELAGDGETAKGLWYIMGGEVDFYSGTGPAANNLWGRVGIDFIKEYGSWKLWHVVCVMDIHAPMGGDWTAPPLARGVPGGYERIAACAMPTPTIETEVYPRYSPGRKFLRFTKIPEAYESFDRKFSYGVE